MLLTKPKTFLTALVTGGLVWATASFAENITVTDMAGRTVDVPHGAERIILGEGRMMYAVAPLMTKDPFKRILGWCRVALKCGIRKSTKSMGSGQNMGVMRRVFCLRRSADHRELRPL